MQVKIGTRKSKLALVQTDLVITEIKQRYPDLDCRVVPIVTSGDVIQDKPLYDIGGKALFLKELEEALLSGKIDIAVHSLKDVPGLMPTGLEIRAVLEREDPRDALVSLKANNIHDLPSGCLLGSSSMRRKITIANARADINIIDLRGNIDSRMNKLLKGNLDAMILAVAGLKRLGLFNPEYCFPIASSDMIPAVGQGIIAMEIRSDNTLAAQICDAVNHLPTWHLTKPERAFMEYVGASCRTPLGAFATMQSQDIVQVRFMLASCSGDKIAFTEGKGNISQGREIGRNAARDLLDKIPNSEIF